MRPRRRSLAVAAAATLGSISPFAGVGRAAPPDDGDFIDPAGTFSVRFAAAPAVVTDPAQGAVSYLVNVEEDSQTISSYGLSAFGTVDTAGAAERVALFLAAAGTDAEQFANSTTRLGPFQAAYFIADVTLSTGTDALLYGVTVVRGNDVLYAFYTDVGGDDSDAGRAFVESFGLLITPVSFDDRWLISFPDDANLSLRASSEDGFAYAEYLAVAGDDTLAVRVTELPPGFVWTADGVAEEEAERIGGAVLESEDVDVGGHSGVRVTLAQDDSDTSGDTVEMLVVYGGDQLFRVAFEDGGRSSPDAATEFIDSFQLLA